MRRLLGFVLPALLAVTLLLPVAAASAAPADTHADGATELLLATEADPDAPAPGLEPMGPNETDNPAAPKDYEANFLWGAAVGLFALVLLGALSMGALYYLLVVRPRQRSASSR